MFTIYAEEIKLETCIDIATEVVAAIPNQHSGCICRQRNLYKWRQFMQDDNVDSLIRDVQRDI